MSEQPVNPDLTSDDKLWAMLAYILTPIVPIIVMLMEDKKNRPFIKAHNAQALVIGVAPFGLSMQSLRRFSVWVASPRFLRWCL